MKYLSNTFKKLSLLDKNAILDFEYLKYISVLVISGVLYYGVIYFLVVYTWISEPSGFMGIHYSRSSHIFFGLVLGFVTLLFVSSLGYFSYAAISSLFNEFKMLKKNKEKQSTKIITKLVLSILIFLLTVLSTYVDMLMSTNESFSHISFWLGLISVVQIFLVLFSPFLLLGLNKDNFKVKFFTTYFNNTFVFNVIPLTVLILSYTDLIHKLHLILILLVMPFLLGSLRLITKAVPDIILNIQKDI